MQCAGDATLHKLRKASERSRFAGPSELESLLQERVNMSYCQYDGEVGGMAMNEQALSAAVEGEDSVQSEKRETEMGEQQKLVKFKHTGEKNTADSLGNQNAALGVDGDGTQFANLDREPDIADCSAAAKKEPDDEEDMKWRALMKNSLESTSRLGGEAGFSTFSHMDGSAKKLLQGIITDDQPGFERLEHTEYPCVSEGEGHVSLTSVNAADSWRNETAKSGFDETMDVSAEEAIGHHTRQSNAIAPDARLNIGTNRIQHHQASGRPINSATKSPSPHHSTRNIPTPFAHPKTFSSYSPSTQFPSQRQPPNQPSFDPSFARQQQLQAQIEQKRRELDNARRLHEQTLRQARPGNGTFGFAQSFDQSQERVSTSFLMGPLSYQRAPQSGYQQSPYGNSGTTHQGQTQFGFPYGQVVSRRHSGLYPVQDGEVAGMSTTNFNRQPLGPYSAQDEPKQQQQAMDEGDFEPETNGSDDDEPLKTRIKRHPSITSQKSTANTSPPLAQTPPPHPNPLHRTTPSPTNTPIDWKLPQYDIQLQPSSPSKTTKDASVPIAKISLPGLVREELVLSPDHAAQEAHLFLSVFLPAQRALSTPDPEPALAVLNFHTIAVMVIEAYVQYEIGDEMGRTGPLFSAYTQGKNDTKEDKGEGGGGGGEGEEEDDYEYERIRSARSANVDDIFFAVIDRWRAGLESNKQSLRLIRGVQEFCDVALDVVYYIKEHGLLVPEEGEKKKKERKERKKEEGIAVLKARKKEGAKRKAPMDKGETQPRKKGKAGEEGKKKKRVPVTPGVTVVKR
jgi:hypothetical protein